MSDAKTEILDVLSRYLSDIPMAQHKANALVDDLSGLLAAEKTAHGQTFERLVNLENLAWAMGEALWPLLQVFSNAEHNGPLPNDGYHYVSLETIIKLRAACAAYVSFLQRKKTEEAE